MTAKELRAKFEQDLKNLQDNCPHIDESGWMDYMWAPGHLGPPVKVCNTCEKIWFFRIYWTNSSGSCLGLDVNVLLLANGKPISGQTGGFP